MMDIMDGLNNFLIMYMSPNNIMLIFVAFLIIIAIAIMIVIYSEVKRNKNNYYDYNKTFNTLENNNFNSIKEEVKEENVNTINNSFSLESIKQELENEEITKRNEENKYRKIEAYEKEQEEKAIISYEELLKNASKIQIDYDDEDRGEDIFIRKVDITENNNNEGLNLNMNISSFYSYKEEEEFLKALKEFRANL